ncbi:shikimate dehydrogenase [Leifsonia shinshuensis]|uniref:shikimate dehydrogenase n=1 Tax=Leifsonia shinshuensis TaxID=150026 RepID=UPI001F514E73|nr:shikimate dehydrogenase [Leifsonia shinshuensis]MCI0159120.1 shikimate dehydrogenase [Leifsonia shinshuensis]
MSVVGESYLVGLVGEGVRPSLTPPLHEREADRNGLRYLYRPLDLLALGRPAADLDTTIGRLLGAAVDLGFSALNITHPCKQLVLSHLDEVSPSAAAIGSVNTVLFADGRRIGHNTDVTGFASALRDGLPGAGLDDVVVIGAGGAGAAVTCALLEAGASRLTVADLDEERAGALADSLAARFPEAAVAGASSDALAARLKDRERTVTGLVNASFVGMHTHPGIPLEPTLLRPEVWVADIVYRPIGTELVRAARATGCRTLDGGGMAVGQAADAFQLITGVEPDRERMRDHFFEMVEEGR